MTQRKRLGECLVEASVITEEQLQEVLALQKKSRKRLGQLLLGLKWASEEEVCQAVSRVLSIDYVNIDEAQISQDVVQLIPEALAVEQNILPLFIQNKTLYLAMENPLDINVIQRVEFLAGMQIKPVIALSSHLEEVIRRHYDVEEYVGNMLARMTDQGEVSVEQSPDPMDVVEGAEELGDLRELSEGSQTVKLVNMLIADGIKKRATDIHIEPNAKNMSVRYRVDGMLTGAIPILKWFQLPMTSRIKVIAGMDITEQRKPQDGRIKVNYASRGVDLRVSTLPSNFGEKVVLRILDKETSSHDLKRLGISQEHLDLYSAILRQPHGWILVTGPTGSGKTTTLYASLNTIRDTSKSIVTVEDPIEYQLEGINQVQVNPRAGLTFANGLRSILRQDPDIILVGEIRDTETASTAMQAAETGHLVLSTLHTNDAFSTINRLFNLEISADLVASNLMAVVAQRLARKICPKCKTEYVPDTQELQQIGISESMAAGVTFYKGLGCEVCLDTGYYGRIGLYEIFAPNTDLRNLIAERPSPHVLKQQALKAGMKNMLQDGIEKVLQGVTSIAEVARVCAVGQETLQAILKSSDDQKRTAPSEASEKSDQIDAAQPKSASEQKGRILLAEDDAATRKTISILLKQHGYEVIQTKDGEEALKKIRASQPDLILLDIDMPKHDGFAVCKETRSHMETMFVPIIMLTARDSVEEKIKGLSLGADDYITKPFHPDELVVRIDSVLRRSAQQDRNTLESL
ncbi:MAG: Flp pilus assembly complex ATPase component [bacterium]|nr:Flp pilus assembly complex ATPase component [bacterium]